MGEHEHAAGYVSGDLQRAEEPREEVLVRVAVAQDHRPDPLRMSGGRQLAHGPAGVVADERRALEVERAEDLGDRPRQSRRTEVGCRRHRHVVGAERPVGDDAPEAVGEKGDDLAPQCPVDEQAVDEDQSGPLTDLVVADGTGRRADLQRRRPDSRGPGHRAPPQPLAEIQTASMYLVRRAAVKTAGVPVPAMSDRCQAEVVSDLCA